MPPACLRGKQQLSEARARAASDGSGGKPHEAGRMERACVFCDGVGMVIANLMTMMGARDAAAAAIQGGMNMNFACVFVYIIDLMLHCRESPQQGTPRVPDAFRTNGAPQSTGGRKGKIWGDTVRTQADNKHRHGHGPGVHSCPPNRIRDVIRASGVSRAAAQWYGCYLECIWQLVSGRSLPVVTRDTRHPYAEVAGSTASTRTLAQTPRHQPM